MNELPPGDKFTPLDPRELAAVPKPSKGVDWMAVVPVPEGAQLPRSLVNRCCPPGHAFVGSWPYRTPGGGVSSVIVRYNAAEGDGKEFKPFTYCRGPAGKREWRCKAPPEPRQIFNLDKIAARPDARVLIVEGEGAAVSAALIFPDYVVTTSSGGSNQFDKACWSRVSGRDVTIWPDHDAPGGRYAAGVAELALKAGAHRRGSRKLSGEMGLGQRFAGTRGLAGLA